MGNCITSMKSSDPHLKVRDGGESATLDVNAGGQWSWHYDVPERAGRDSLPRYAALEKKMQEKVQASPRFAHIPHDRLVRHFARFNPQFESNGQPVVLRSGPPQVFRG